MLVTDMHILFKTLYDKVDSLQYPNLLPEEIDLFLNLSVDQLIEYKIGRTNNKQIGADEIQIRIDDLKDIIKTVELTGVASIDNPNEIVFALPEDYRHFWAVTPKYISRNCGEGFSNEPRQIRFESLGYYLTDPFDGPFYNQPIYLFERNQLIFYKMSDYNIPFVKFTYVVQPEKLDVNIPFNNCPFPDYVCKQIVTWAIDAAIEGIESPRVQTFPRQLEKSQ